MSPRKAEPEPRGARIRQIGRAATLTSIAQKVMAVGFVAFTLGILLTVLSGFFVYDSRLQRRADESNIRYTRLIADQVAPGIHIDRQAGVRNALREYTAAAGGDLTALATYTDEGERLTSFRRENAPDLLPQQIDPEAYDSARRGITQRGGLIVPARLSDDRVAGYVASAWDSDSLDAIRWEALIYSFAAAGAAWLLSGALLWTLLTQVVTRPIRRLTDVVLRFSDQHSGRAAVDDPDVVREVTQHRERADEIGRMAQALDLLRDSEAERRRTEQALAQAKRETDDILATVDEGLFLVRRTADGDFVLGDQHSQALSGLLGTGDLPGRPILELLGDQLDAQQRDDLHRFLRLLFEPRVEEDTLDDLNPLAEIALSVAGGRRHLAFRFQRVLDETGVSKVLAIATDRTETVELSRQLAESERRSRSRMALLARVLETDPGMLEDFIAAGRRDLEQVETALQAEAGGAPDTRRAFQAAHAIKGNAALLDLDFVVERAHALEDALAQGADHGDLTAIADDLRGALSQLDDVIARLARFRDTFGDGSDSPTEATVKAIRAAVDKTAADCGKQAEVQADGFDVAGEDDRTRLLIKDAVVQLVRNAVYHGIEPTEQRRREGKPAAGTIALDSTRAEGRITIRVTDDGRGIATDALRPSARDARTADGDGTGDGDGDGDDADADDGASGSAGAGIAGDDHDGGAELVFESGVSSSDHVSTEAGRGVGLDLVRERVRAAGGEIQVATETGRYTRFDITLPSGSGA